MEPSRAVATAPPEDVVARIEQKALRLSALLRDIDNHPIELEASMREQLDDILEMVACRVTATRALLRQPSELQSPEETVPLSAPA